MNSTLVNALKKVLGRLLKTIKIVKTDSHTNKIDFQHSQIVNFNIIPNQSSVNEDIYFFLIKNMFHLNALGNVQRLIWTFFIPKYSNISVRKIGQIRLHCFISTESCWKRFERICFGGLYGAQ